MSHNVETMFYTREKPWHGLGTPVQNAPTSKEAIRLAGLDWDVLSNPIYDGKGLEIAGYRANTRSSDGKVLGVVSSRYSIVQNSDAFDFTDSLIGEGIAYETAGSLSGGKTIWLLGKMPERFIAGDKVEPYICFTNTHDGTGAVRVCMTPIRVVCNNTLNLALQGATRSWSAVHRGSISSKLAEARSTLALAEHYITALDETADKLANERLSDGEAEQILEVLVKLPDGASDRLRRNVETVRDGITACMLSPDLVRFLHTKWGFINAVADYVDHAPPARITGAWQENRWGNIITGHSMLDRAFSLVSKGV